MFLKWRRLQRISRRFFKEKLRYALAKLRGKHCVHFLHIGKTGGTAIKEALKRTSPGEPFVVFMHPHRVRLRDIPRGEGVFFVVRDPAKRFVSGFYSRKRQGRPRYFDPWSAGEKKAFSFFGTPNELAEALYSEDESLREKALFAMSAIRHVNSSYWDWFESPEYFLSRKDDIFFIGRQENLTQDFEILKLELSLPPQTTLPRESVRLHETPKEFDTRLSEKAMENLKQWYKRDYEFLALCQKLSRFGNHIKKP